MWEHFDNKLFGIGKANGPMQKKCYYHLVEGRFGKEGGIAIQEGSNLLWPLVTGHYANRMVQLMYGWQWPNLALFMHHWYKNKP